MRNETKIDIAAWMQRKDQNGEFGGITASEAFEIIQRWYEDSGYSDKGCKRMLDHLVNEMRGELR